MNEAKPDCQWCNDSGRIPVWIPNATNDGRTRACACCGPADEATNYTVLADYREPTNASR